MYPNIPFSGLSWPLTQHAGVISEEIIRGLISACMLCNGQSDAETINRYLVDNNLLTANFREDSQRVDAWRDYQQILSEFGLIYSTNITRNEIILTPIAIAFADGEISYSELITLQALRYQYPNGHKTQSSPSLKRSYEDSFHRSYDFNTFAEMQASMGILIRPVVAIWQTLYGLYLQGEDARITIDEMQTYLVRCLKNSDVSLCIECIINARHTSFRLEPLHRARRNMQDWIKILNQTPLFYSDSNRNSFIALSQYSIDHAEEVNAICDHLCKPESFWVFTNSRDLKFSWFDFYGNIDLGTKWIPDQEMPSSNHIEDNDISTQRDPIDEPRDIVLHPFKPLREIDNNNHKQIVSIYDYKKSREGYKLHDNMVNIIANRCVDKGADVYYDSKTVDLFVKFKDSEFIVEVKSITPSNFIARLRTAIGQVNQYDYFMHQGSDIRGRLGLAFTATIPKSDWTVPFITNHLNMDLLYLESNALSIISNNALSRELYG
ncbi:MAG: hypothetical protein IJD53_03245 [Alistipes sp.]|nr:hypothetical protein [Alistipes sp.]